jgi:OTU domain-containing protein 6
VIRKTAAQYMRDHKDDFIAFLPSIGGEDTATATDDGMMTDQGFEKYCRLVAETGEWGGEPEVSQIPLPLSFLRFPELSRLISGLIWSGLED